MPRSRRPLAGVAYLVVGFVLIAMLGGVVVKHLLAGPTPWSVLGAAAGIGGIVLMVHGWQLSLGGVRRRWVRVSVAVVGTLVVAQFVLLPAIIALDATDRPKAIGSGRTPADLGLAYEDVSLRTEDGVAIAAWWVPGERDAAVVVLPGAGSTRDDALDHAAILVEDGYGALLLDLRGHGQSEGPRNEFGWGAERDVDAAVDWLEARPDVDGIGVLGLSMGGEVALTAAGLDPRIDAVVAEGATARTWADASGVPNPHPVGLANEWVMFALVDLLSEAPEPEPLGDAIADIDAPVLLVMGAPDHEQQLGPVYAGTNPDRVTLWALPDTPHIAALRVHPDEYREQVAAVFASLDP